MTNKNQRHLPVQVLKKFRVIYGAVRQHFRQIEELCGISGSQLWLLQEIANTPGIGVSALADHLAIHQSTCSNLVEKLVKQQLITKQRSTVDQRRVGLHPTAAGLTTIAKAPGPAEGILPEALSALPEVVLDELNASLSEVISQLRVRDENLSKRPLADM